MADFIFSYCGECGTMNFYCLGQCPACKALRSMRMVAFYFDEPDHVEYGNIVFTEDDQPRTIERAK